MGKSEDAVDDLVADTTRGYEKIASPAALKAIRTALGDVFATHPVMQALIAEDLPRETPDESGENVRDPKLLAELKAKAGQKSG